MFICSENGTIFHLIRYKSIVKQATLCVDDVVSGSPAWPPVVSDLRVPYLGCT